jgi:hypothetical protein
MKPSHRKPGSSGMNNVSDNVARSTAYLAQHLKTSACSEICGGTSLETSNRTDGHDGVAGLDSSFADRPRMSDHGRSADDRGRDAFTDESSAALTSAVWMVGFVGPCLTWVQVPVELAEHCSSFPIKICPSAASRSCLKPSVIPSSLHDDVKVAVWESTGQGRESSGERPEVTGLGRYWTQTCVGTAKEFYRSLENVSVLRSHHMSRVQPFDRLHRAGPVFLEDKSRYETGTSYKNRQGKNQSFANENHS